MASSKPRIVFVTRKTLYEQLLERLGTFGQAEFYLKTRGQSIEDQLQAHEHFERVFADVQGKLPADQRRVRVDRDELDRFLFAPDDVIVMVGQDGLVPNTAKYLSGQTALGINPDPERYDGILCQHGPDQFSALLEWLGTRSDERFYIEQRTMAVAEREDGQTLLALNEVFVGHGSHQSARYRLIHRGREERHSSSGLICATGTGSTGWVRSIVEQRGIDAPMPEPDDPRLAWFVREPFPSVYTGTALSFDYVDPGETLEIVSEMGQGGVIFADGIESDRVEFLDGHSVVLRRAETALNLVMDAAKPSTEHIPAGMSEQAAASPAAPAGQPATDTEPPPDRR